MSNTNQEETQSAVMHTYARFPIAIKKGKGSYVFDEKDQAYLDFTSGIATCNLGHVPDKVTQKMHEQLDTLWHCSNLYEIPVQEKLAESLVQQTVFDQVFFCNSGAEANEAAIKIAKKYAKDHQQEERTTIATFGNSFHGRTMATLTATGQEKIQKGFSPLMPGFRYLAFNDEAALDQIHDGQTAAVLIELVQGEGGVNPAEEAWVKKLAEICQAEDILLMVDEVQTGMGRTGTLFAYEQYGIEPDVMTVAKGLGSGFPIGAMLAKKKVAETFTPGVHGTTFGGNPLATTAGLATLTEMVEPGFLQEVQSKSQAFMQELKTLAKDSAVIKEVRGMGFLIGLELSVEAKEVVVNLQKEQILTLSAGPNVLRILPPLTATEEELMAFSDKLSKVLAELEAKMIKVG